MTPEEVCRRYEELKSDRSNWENLWQQVAERVLPRAADFNTTRTPGEQRTQKIFDSTAPLALDRFAAAMESILTPRTSRWHHLTSSEPELEKDAKVKAWMDEAEEVLFRARYSPKANYASQQHEGYVSLGAFGSGVLYVEQGRDTPLVYRNIHLAEPLFAENAYGQIDTCFRRFEMTARQAAQYFDSLPSNIDPDKKPDDKHWFIHAVYPRSDRDPRKADSRNMAWASITVAEDGKRQVKEGGFRTFPYMVGRYVVAPGEVYGRSPAIQVLPDIKTLNEAQRSIIKATQQNVEPAILVHDDGVAFDVRPNALNYGMVSKEGRPLAMPFNQGGQLSLGEQLIDRWRMVINDAFLVTLFQILVDTPTMTATEAMFRAQEKGALLAPTMGRQQSESLGPMIERELDILMDLGALPPLPEALVEAQGAYEIEYDSPLSRAQQNEKVTGILRTMEIAAGLAQFDPRAMMVLDAEAIVRVAGEVNGVPQEVLRSKDAVEAMMAQMQQEQALAQAAAAAPGVGSAIKDVASAAAA